MGGGREKRCTAGGDVILKQYCPPEERNAGQNTVLRMLLLAESVVCVCKVRQAVRQHGKDQIPNKADNF